MNKFKSYFKEHLPLFAFAIIALCVYLLTPTFADISFGAMRTAVVLALIFGSICLIFRETVMPYLYDGQFVEDFKALEPSKRPWYALAAIAIIAYICTTCVTHAGGFEQMQENRWAQAQIRPEKVRFVDDTCLQITRSQPRYEALSARSGVPWRIIACLHNMECGLSFYKHLHNGDPLYAKTVNEPAGRPEGSPPWTWEASAIDALGYDRMRRKNWSGIGASLQNMEGFNGTGYELYHPAVPTPYLWSWTTLYTRGKYVADGRFDAYAISRQCGIAAILKRLR